MASVTGSWIEKTILQHDKDHGANLATPWRGKRFCQVVRFEAPFDDTTVQATISDETHTIRVFFDLNSVKALEIKRLNSTTPTKALRSRVRAVFQIEEFVFRIVPRRRRPLPEIVLDIRDWDIYTGDSTNSLFWPDARPVSDYDSPEARAVVTKWFTGHSDSSPVQTKPRETMYAAPTAGPSCSQPPLTFITDFLQPYLFPANGAKQNTVPEWIFHVAPEDRSNLDSMTAFPLVDDDLQKDLASPLSSSPTGSPAHDMLSVDRKGKRKASPASATPSFPPLGQPMPSCVTPDTSNDSPHRQGTLMANALDALEDPSISERRPTPEISHRGQIIESLDGMHDDSAEDDEYDADLAIKKPRRIVKSRFASSKRDPMALFSQSTAPSSQAEPDDAEASRIGNDGKSSDVDPLDDDIPDDQLSEYSRERRNERRRRETSTHATPMDRLGPEASRRPALQERRSETDVEAVEHMSSLANDESQIQIVHRPSTPKSTSRYINESQAKSEEHTESFDASDPSNEAFSLSRYEKRHITVEVKRDHTSTPIGRQLDRKERLATPDEDMKPHRHSYGGTKIESAPPAVNERTFFSSPKKLMSTPVGPIMVARTSCYIAEVNEDESLPPPPDDLPQRYRSPHEPRRSTSAKAFTPHLAPESRPRTPVVVVPPIDERSQSGRAARPQVDYIKQGSYLATRKQGSSKNSAVSAVLDRDFLCRQHSPPADEETTEENQRSSPRNLLNGFVLDLRVLHGVSDELVQDVLRTARRYPGDRT